MKTWTFIHATDIHVGSPRSFRFQPAWNENWQTARQQIIQINPDLLLIGGDLTRDGNIHKYEFENLKADLDTLPFPYHVIPGNMDTNNKHTRVPGPLPGRNDVELNVTSENLCHYREVFGTPWWTFVHKDVRFSAFGGMLLGSGLPEERELWAWLEAQQDQPRSRYHVWLTHYPLFTVDLHESNYDITDPEQYFNWYFGLDEPYRSRVFEIMKATGVTHVLSGHVHMRKRFYVEGVHFDIGASTAFTQAGIRSWTDGDRTLGFQRYEVTDQGLVYTFIPLARVSTAKSYGPGGHPRPDQRDYSLAWEK